MNPQSEEANETWKFVETTEEEKATIYRYLSKVYLTGVNIKQNLFN